MKTETQPTLLERLRDGTDPMAWEVFFDRYWRLVFASAKRRGCADDTAEEIVQDVMLAVYEKRQVFRYDPARGRFRDWLGAIVRNQVAKRRRRPAERIRAPGGDAQPFPEPEGRELQADLAWEAGFEKALLGALLDAVRRETSPATYQAFELLVLHGLPGAQVAKMTGLTRNAVYLAHRRVLRRLRELGAMYRNDGQLDDQLKEVLKCRPSADIERSVTTRIEQTMRST